MTWHMNKFDGEWLDGKVAYISLFNDDINHRPRHFGCYFRFKPELKKLPTPQILYKALFPDAPEYTDQRMTDYLLMLFRVRGGIACDFRSTDGGQTIQHESARREEIDAQLAELIEVYEAGVPVEDILA